MKEKNCHLLTLNPQSSRLGKTMYGAKNSSVESVDRSEEDNCVWSSRVGVEELRLDWSRKYAFAIELVSD